jgi:hypothetical protein
MSLWVKIGKWQGSRGTSVLPSTADIVRLLRHVRKVPIAVSTSIRGFRSRPLTFSVQPTRWAATAIYLRSIYGSGLTTGTAQVMLARDQSARDET